MIRELQVPTRGKGLHEITQDVQSVVTDGVPPRGPPGAGLRAGPFHSIRRTRIEVTPAARSMQMNSLMSSAGVMAG